jgi:hypothetical protein
MLDPDAYGSSSGGSGGGSGSGPAPITHAGKNSTGGGLAGKGGTSSGAPGSSGSTSLGGKVGAGTNPDLSLVPCQQYCPGYGTQCVKRLNGQACLPTCQSELNNFGPACQTLGISALRCLTPFFTPNGRDCDVAVNRALTQCSVIVKAFQDCKQGVSTPTPGPQPTPTVDVASCPSMGSSTSDGGSCQQFFSCPSGTFMTFCSPSGMSQPLAECNCVSPSGAQVGTLLLASPDACFNAANLCSGLN